MKCFSILVSLLLISNFVKSQILIQGQTDLACPGEPINYATQPVSTGNSSCIYQWNITNGVFSNGSTQIQGNYFSVNSVTVLWDNVLFQGGTSIPQGTLTVSVFGCALPTGERTTFSENVVVKTLNGVTPGNIFGNSSIPIGNTTNRTFSIPRIQFPGTGQPGGSVSIAYADSYEWLIPSGW